MVLLQAVISLISRSAGKIFSAMFGWAVSALFGRTSPRERTVLSVVVGAAAAWPILLLGVLAPKIATFVVAFVPLESVKSVHTGTLRLVWIGLALLLPVVVGIVFNRRAPVQSPADNPVVRLLRGFQITLGLAAAFLFVLVAAPIRKIISLFHGWMDEAIPLIVETKDFVATTRRIENVLLAHGFEIARVEPGWAMKAPGAILSTLGGKAFERLVPDQVALYRSKDLEVLVTPTGVTLRGKEQTTSRAHGLIAEAMTETPALQSMNAEAQEIENQIKDVWKVYAARPEEHRGSAALLSRLAAISKEIGKLPVPYDEWQIVYRQALQLSRALHGQSPLLSTLTPESKEDVMSQAPEGLEEMPLKTLLSEITERVGTLATKQVALARAEIEEDVKSQIAMAKSVGLAAVSAVLGLNMLLVAAAFALATRMAPWAAALIVAAPFLVLAAVLFATGWAKRVKKPLDATRAELKEDMEWAKNRLA